MVQTYIFEAVLALKEKLAPHGISVAWEMEPSGIISAVWIQVTDPHDITPLSFPVSHDLITHMDATLVYRGLLIALEWIWALRDPQRGA
jgi:hypothetical protein